MRFLLSARVALLVAVVAVVAGIGSVVPHYYGGLDEFVLLNVARLLHVIHGMRVTSKVLVGVLVHRGWEASVDDVDLGQCHDDLPLQNAVWRMLESRSSQKPPRKPDPVPELFANSSLPWNMREASICAEFLLASNKFNSPVVIRDLLPDSHARKWGKYLKKGKRLSKKARKVFRKSIAEMYDYAELSRNWDKIRQCPWKRKQLGQTTTSIIDVKYHFDNGKKDIYVAFSEFLPFMMNMSGLVKYEDRLLNLCGYDGYASEMFFGAGADAGTPMHNAMTDNLFWQVIGSREWTLWSPGVTQYLRSLQSLGFSQSLHIYEDWAARRYTRAAESVPRMKTTLRPGDVLLIPYWWHHEVRIPNDTFSMGMSHRGNSWHKRWEALPVFRAAYSEAPLDVLSYDIVHGMYHWLAGQGRNKFGIENLISKPGAF